jgi:hypothetical protein
MACGSFAPKNPLLATATPSSEMTSDMVKKNIIRSLKDPMWD